MNEVISSKQIKGRHLSHKKNQHHSKHKSTNLINEQKTYENRNADSHLQAHHQKKLQYNPNIVTSASFINSEIQVSQNFKKPGFSHKPQSKETMSTNNQNILLQDGVTVHPATTLYSNHFGASIPYVSDIEQHYHPLEHKDFKEDAQLKKPDHLHQQMEIQYQARHLNSHSHNLKREDTDPSPQSLAQQAFVSPQNKSPQHYNQKLIIQERSSAQLEVMKYQLNSQPSHNQFRASPNGINGQRFGGTSTSTLPRYAPVPTGSIESYLYISKLIIQGHQVNLRIADTIIGNRQQETQYLSNIKNVQSASNSQGFNYHRLAQRSVHIPQTQSSNLISCQSIKNNQIEERVCKWLQASIEKSKSGSFVPLSIKKIKSRPSLRTETHLDFFVASTLHKFNQGFKQIRSNGQSYGNGSEEFFILQRYIPQKNEYTQIIRGLWKKGKGFKFYKLISFYPYSGQRELIRKTASLHTSTAQLAQQSEESKDRESNVKLLTFNELSDVYQQVLKLEGDRLTQASMQAQGFYGSSEFNYSKNVKIDLNSRKNQQHLIIQQKLESNYHVQQQFQIIDREPKTFAFQKVRTKDEQTFKQLTQVQTQMTELVRLLNEHTLRQEGLELLKLTADFVEDYSDQTINFLQIKSYIVEDLPENNFVMMPEQVLNAERRQSMSQTATEVNRKRAFSCHGDYCYIQDDAYVPKHLAPIVTDLIKHEHLKVAKKTIMLERDNIKDNFRAYNLSDSLFHTMIEQETLMRQSLNDNQDLEVCPSCFHVYQFLQRTYYENKTSNRMSDDDFQRRMSQEDYQEIMRQSHKAHQNQQMPKTLSISQNQRQDLNSSQKPGSLDKNVLFSQYQRFLNGEEIKEDLLEENKDSKEYNQTNNMDSHQQVQTFHQDQQEYDQDQDYGAENQEEDNDQVYGQEDADPEEEEEEADQYRDVLVETVQTRNDTFKDENAQTNSRFNIGLEENSNSPDFNDRSDFRIPSDLQSSHFKQTHISNLGHANHHRFNTLATPLSQQAESQGSAVERITPVQQKPIHTRNNQSVNQRPPSNYQAHLVKQSIEKQRAAQQEKTQQKTFNSEFQETEFNPIQKFKIQPRASRKLRTNDTGEFGGQANISVRSSSSIKQQTFSVAQIISKVRASQDLKQHSINQSLTSFEKKQSIPSIGSKRSSIKDLVQKRDASINASLHSFVSQKQLQPLEQTPTKINQLTQTLSKQNSVLKANVSSQVTIKEKQFSNNVELQTGDSLMFLTMKPPLANSSTFVKDELLREQSFRKQPSFKPKQVLAETPYRNQTININQSVLSSQISNKSKLTISQIEPERAESQQKRNSGYSNQDHSVKNPLLPKKQTSPDNSVRNVKHSISNDLILKVPHPIASHSNTSVRNSKSKNRLRSWSLTGGINSKKQATQDQKTMKAENEDHPVEAKTTSIGQKDTMPTSNMIGTLENKIKQIISEDIEEAPTRRQKIQNRIPRSSSNSNSNVHNNASEIEGKRLSSSPTQPFNNDISVLMSRQNSSRGKKLDLQMQEEELKVRSTQENIPVESFYEKGSVRQSTHHSHIKLVDLEPLPNIEETESPSQNLIVINDQQQNQSPLFQEEVKKSQELQSKLGQSMESYSLPEVILPYTPPQLKLDIFPFSSELQPRTIETEQHENKRDSFFGKIVGTSEGSAYQNRGGQKIYGFINNANASSRNNSIEDEYLVDYIISNEDGDMSSSLMNSNPQLNNIAIQNNTYGKRNSQLGENSSKTINMILSSGAQGISSLGGMILKMPIGKKNSALISSLEKVIEDTTSQQ